MSKDQSLITPFIKLQSMFLDNLMNGSLVELVKVHGEEKIEAKKNDIENILNGSGIVISQEEKEKYDSLKGKIVISQTEKEEYDKLKGSKKNEDEPEDEPKIDAVYGYIGELLYKGFLEKLQVEHQHAAENGVNKYDFEYKDKNNAEIYLDIKTAHQ
jgi:type IV secretory pathway VirB4 component